LDADAFTTVRAFSDPHRNTDLEVEETATRNLETADRRMI